MSENWQTYGERVPSVPPPPPPQRLAVPQYAPPASGDTTAASASMPPAAAASSSWSSRFLTRGANAVSRAADTVSPRVQYAAAGASARWESYRSRPRAESPDEPSPASSASAPSASAVATRLYSTSTRLLQPSTSGWSSYFSREPKPEEQRPEDERISIFPGTAVLRPAHDAECEPAMVLDVTCSGLAYRLKPLSQASRSQRVFYALAKQLAALPRVPEHLARKISDHGLSPHHTGDKSGGEGKGPDLSQELDNGDLAGLDAKSQEELLRELENIEGDAEGPEGLAKVQALGGNDARPAASGDTTPRRRAPPPPPPPVGSKPAAQRRATADNASVMSGATTSSHEHHWPKPFSFEEEDLPRLHLNLQSRLIALFSSKLEERLLRVTVFPAGREDVPLASRIVSSGSTGAFKTTLEVRPPRLRKILDKMESDMSALDSMRLQIKVELLEREVPQSEEDRSFQQGYKVAKSNAADECFIEVSKDGGIRVISDIDDTIKHSEVLAGTRSIFRNVFVRDFKDTFVPGMSELYTELRKQGCHFHYVSNAPYELVTVVRSFLFEGGFPVGSLTLKDYTGGGSMLSRLWEDPGQRKRAGVEALLQRFPDSRFVLVGDSGEADLELYASLSRCYPSQVLAIFIRDVSTPYRPSDAAAASSDALSEIAGNARNGDRSRRPGGGTLPRVLSGTKLTSSPAISRVSSTTSFASLSKTNTSSSAATRQSTPSILFDTDSDALSPNNPLRPGRSLGDSLTEEQIARVENFYTRVGHAERHLPDGCILRIFRHGFECIDEAAELIRQAQGG